MSITTSSTGKLLTTGLTRGPTSVVARRRLTWIAAHAIAIAVAVIFVVPFVFITLTAFMSDNQTLTSNLWPTSWHPGNFVEVFHKAPLFSYLGNSLMYSGLATVFMLVSSVPAAYALSRFTFRFRNALFLAVIAMMVLPPQVTQVPVYLMWAKLDLTGTLWPLILPNLLGDAFSIFLLRQFLLTIPEEYADAARIDGCSEWAVMTKIILPMAKPALAATGMFMFFASWNDYYGPLLYTSENTAHWTVSLGLAQFRTNHAVQWNLTMAATLLMMLPVMVLFFFAQKAFVEGVTLTGVKG
jgi:multiple sugar transport system permease protein